MSLNFYQNLNRIKKGAQQKEIFVVCKEDSLTLRVLDLLWAQGFILGYRHLSAKTNSRQIKIQVFLKFWGPKSVLQNLKIVSRPQKRVFLRWQALTRIYNKHELLVLSTPQGVLSHYDCLKAKIGGEILCIIA
jgi:small subunit ribosomal protein S8